MSPPSDLAAALHRARAALQRCPALGLHDDVPATIRWEGGTHITATHANGAQIETDMPCELGGSGHRVTPGWLLRAGLASCTATRIAMAAALEGIALQTLELQVSSRSDTRGLLGMADADGAPVHAGPRDMQMRVRIAARGVSAERLRALVEYSQRSSPVPVAVQEGVKVDLRIEVAAG